MKRVIKEYYEQLYAHRFDHLDEKDKFLERHQLPKLTQEEVNNTKRCLCLLKTESIINHLSDVFSGEFCQPFKEEVIPVFYNRFQKIEAGLNSFYDPSVL